MILLDLLFALTVATVLTALFKAGYREQKTGETFMGFFIVVFLATWAGGMWLAPAVSATSGMAWLPYLLVGVFVAILVASALLSVRSQNPLAWAAAHGGERRDAEVAAFNIIFWLLVLALGIAVLRRVI